MTSATQTAVVVVDAIGSPCPGPLVKAKRALSTIAPGESFELKSTDVGTCADIASWCERTGSTLVKVATSDQGVFSFTIRRNR